MDAVDVVVSAVLNMVLTYTVVACDRLRLTPEQRERTWNSASTASAIFAFAPLCIVAHFWVTRRSFRGVLLGLLWLVLLVALQTALMLVGNSLGFLWVLALLVAAPVAPVLIAPILVAALAAAA
jgi:hypothetical protein